MTSGLPARVRIVEVGPRDGLQNETAIVATKDKIALVDALSATGLPHVEVTAFVNPARIPQLADAEDVCRGIARRDGVVYSALVPNDRGYDRATADAGLRHIAVFLSASQTHNRRNIGCTIEEAFERYRTVVARARDEGVGVRGYVSTAFGCPYEGEVPMERAVEVSRALFDLGCEQISLGDTTGVGNPVQVAQTVTTLGKAIGIEQVALHLHDTYGAALANALAGLQEGVTTFDSSIGGLGGCPYAPGATGNAATDELVAMLEAMGVRTGVDREALLAAAAIAQRGIGREPPSRWLKATRATRTREEAGHGI